MFEIWQWLEGDKDYFKGVELLGKYCPNHLMLESLKIGNMSVVNRAYLERILKDTFKDLKGKPSAKPKPVTAKKERKVKEFVKQLTHDDFKRIAEKELAAAYADRRRFSNQFHFCKTDEERAVLSDEIKEVIQDINSLKTRLAAFKSTGVMPPKVEITGFKTPESDVDLERSILNYRAKVSTQKRLIENYDIQPRKKTKAQHELKLTELRKKLKQLEDERESRN